MSDGFDPNNHKNLELFRYYLNNYLEDVKNELRNKESNYFGYFVASIVDVIIVTLFNDVLKRLCIPIRALIAIGLVLFFGVVCFVSNKMKSNLINSEREKGRGIVSNPDDIQKQIDKFDNIACDGLLICDNYMNQFYIYKKDNTKAHLMEFCYYEILHHFKKSYDIFKEITRADLSHSKGPNISYQYISSTDYNLININRINNYIDFAKVIYRFLKDERKVIPPSSQLDSDILFLGSIQNESHYEEDRAF